ncbi:MAG: hypothetical protein V9E88_01220 [Ferruginibacter sp.]
MVQVCDATVTGSGSKAGYLFPLNFLYKMNNSERCSHSTTSEQASTSSAK